MRSSQRNFWSGFAAGAATSSAALLLWRSLWQSGDRRILRVESSIQIGRPVADVFRPWLNLQELPQFSPIIRSVAPTSGNRSHWCVRFDGQDLEWEAEIEQLIPNQSIGWKSVRGPKHSGRLIFSPLDGETVLQVRMNYAPRFGFFRRALAPVGNLIHRALEQALRDIKAAFEEGRIDSQLAATGTAPEHLRFPGHMQRSRFGGPPTLDTSSPRKPEPMAPEIKR